ncbi:myeloid leukemia factor isoform X1 [Bactrocera tryoni]|uniref:myeloid leukemia factor isoform X1 n=1 Tax=Bactrocera tryoni TaxID=59916 RepID=UPI001A9616ED|nr:myeloid leukemia factor isoform X1 [Bactrocera tryoni]
MSLFGSLMGDFDDDLFMGNHMNAMNMQMRSMNRLMNSFMPDPFNMLAPFDPGFQQNALMERSNQHVANPMGGLFGFPAMPNINRLLSADIGSPNGASYCSSSVITMSSGPDGRPQIYQATTSTKTGPGGIRETRKTVEDSRRGMKKMAIGHHIGERAHIIEKEQDLRSGQLEERQEFINLEEDDAEDFDREFTNRARGSVRGARPQEMITIESADDDDDVRPRHYSRHHGSGGQHRRQLPALPAPPQQNSSTLSPSSSVDSLNSNSKNNKSHNNTDNLSTERANANATTKNKTTTSTQNSNSKANNNNSYLTSQTTLRSPTAAGYHRGIAARRPLRTPSSSPLATTPTNHSHSTAPTTSVHPHPYNASAARRNYRSKHSKQHQQPHQPQTLTITEVIDDDDDEEVQPTGGAVIVEEVEDDAGPATVINPAAAAAAVAANRTASKSQKSPHH